MLSDVMGNLKLDLFPTIGMILFLIAFVAIAFKVVFASPEEMREAANVPLDDDEPTTTKGA
jgi:cbb3-type cytochrome oxidase subunit 3